MKETKKVKKAKVKYPENLPLKKCVQSSGLKVNYIAKKIGVTTKIISLTINGHYKGVNIVPQLNQLLEKNSN